MKRWTTIIFAILASATIWLIHNLSRETSGFVNVPMVARSNIEGRAELSVDEVTVTANCKASGFKLLKLERQKKPSVVFFNYDELQYLGGDSYSIPVNELEENATQIFGNGVSDIAFVGMSVVCRFARENCKKVPVEPVQSLFFRSQYMSLSPFVLVPDSVMVYADPQRLNSIDRILTRTINRTDIHAQVRGEIDLDCPAGVRLGVKSVEYTMDVTRFVEISSKANLTVRNIPGGRELITIPSSVTVNYRCPFPLDADPAASSEFCIDYRDFAESKTGKVPVRTRQIASNVISFSISPEFCDCVERVK